VSGSGASRTLVLADGVPLNDAFGSWVYWNRVPLAAVDRVEVVRGGSGDLYGSDALGGVVQVLTIAPGRAQLRGSLELGAHDTRRISAFGTVPAGAWRLAMAGEWQETDGVIEVARGERGAVDVPAQGDYRNGHLTLARDAGAWHAQLRATLYSERRVNGTPLQTNATELGQLAGQLAGPAFGGAWLLRAAAGTQTYDQSFSALAPDRSSERATAAQHIPSEFAQASLEWSRGGERGGLRLGLEGRGVRAELGEAAPDERAGAVFARGRFALGGRLTAVLGLRGEAWRSEPGSAALPAHDASFVSPRAGLLWNAGRWRIDASGYRAYRTPTLNELHRDFRVGNVLTRANPRLAPERLTGAEAGVAWSGPRACWRLAGFVSHLDRAIANITVSAAPSSILRERQNAGRIRSAGLELQAELRVRSQLSLSALLALTDSRFRDSARLPELRGNRVPQVPRYQLGAGLTWADPRILTATAQLRVVGSQFEDDQNRLALRRFAVLDAQAGRRLVHRIHAFLAVENLFDAEYDVGRTPARTVGWPRTLRGGLRLFLPR
jgi:outer membrane receptor protein involved in Fe transport